MQAYSGHIFPCALRIRPGHTLLSFTLLHVWWLKSKFAEMVLGRCCQTVHKRLNKTFAVCKPLFSICTG